MPPDPDVNKRTDLNYDSLRAQLKEDADGRFSAVYGDCICSSAFQPIVSLTHGRVVGHEGLLRARRADGEYLPPPQLLDQAIANGEILHLDRLCRTLHVANAGQARDGWLFLNIHPDSFSRAQQANRKAFMAELLKSNELQPRMIVVEILEELIEDEDHFDDSVGYLRELGCLLAIDDFGAGHSNFDRIWKVVPEIVKLDRRFAVQCEADPRARRMLPRIVNMLHEAGSLVLLEGIETQTQAMIALEADIDFAQGYYFARPAAAPLPIHQPIPAVTELWDCYERESHHDYRRRRERIAPYEQAIVKAAMELAMRSEELAGACRPFLDLPGTEFCYLLDEHGLQVGSNVWSCAASQREASSYQPIAGIDGARWSRRPYFRRAMEHFGQVQTTRPYLSTATGNLCVTISIAFHHGRQARVLCGDLRWA
ncbi:MAG TPA: EAL domain-containing protein [Roseateles sp.]|nr:EAL domain-containing protein [Roseateles sp.]